MLSEKERRLEDFIERRVFEVGCNIKNDIAIAVRDMYNFYLYHEVGSTKKFHEQMKKAMREFAQVFNAVSTLIQLDAENEMWVMKDPVTYREDITIKGIVYKYKGYSWCSLDADIMDDEWHERYESDDGEIYIP